ncbi:ADP-ribosylglycohydrolase family protein [Sinomonas sp. JGH33]|uniref:ADP-ribosylglycohydrolase family protein n=1 Tax=Sinomonas terricola TaxID=3110330 RepID=A0ABU5T9D9_9MICC|nr:ADP-ribosylglycohydrolase family protein [Sinomonas sp. JGH33]MEA5456140.1 ADP-ribosylglycohydrolase family protein [Sinomonas sp. JGH33]
MTSSPSPLSRIHGCLAGGAAAEGVVLARTPDAREFMVPGEFGPREEDDGAIRLGAAGQLSLYTADALLEVLEWANAGVYADQSACVWLAFLRWARGQGIPLPSSAPPVPERWIDGQPAARRALPARPDWASSLAGGEMGTPARPLGTAFDDGAAAARSAPFGLVVGTPAEAVAAMAADGASLTHGHASAVHAAVAVALAVREIAEGSGVREATATTREGLPGARGAAPDVIAAVDAALDGVPLSEGSAAARTLHEALAASLAAEAAAASGAVLPEAFSAAIRRTAEAGPDAAAIAGALLGVHWGIDAVPALWRVRLDGEDIAVGLSTALAAASGAD